MKLKASTGCLLLVTFPFAGVGLYAFYKVAGSLLEWRDAQGFTEVPAEILTADLDVQQTDQSVLYRVRATYRYSYEGVEYRGERVSLVEEGDSGSFHQTTFSRLDSARKESRPVPCYVNPANPEESILVRDMRWRLLAFLFGVAVIFVSPTVFVASVVVYLDRKGAGALAGILRSGAYAPSSRRRI